MQRWTAFVFAALTAAFVLAVVLGRGTAKGPTVGLDAGVDASADAALDAASVADGGEVGDAGDSAEEPVAVDPQLAGGSDAGTRLLTGEPAPALAAEAPKSIVFGVILVTYKGAQGAPANARSRDAALELAKQLATDAKQDFKATVAKGDKGSMENAGRMPRGMLEPAPEFVLFSLPKDGVSDPVDTPRGFWIVRRIE
jgi:PPIC-type peptidyl-prolyl cis-trans isomerase-like protein